MSQLEHLVIMAGPWYPDCLAAVVDDNEKNLSLQLQTLQSLTCFINMSKQWLISKQQLSMGKMAKEEISFVETVV